MALTIQKASASVFVVIVQQLWTVVDGSSCFWSSSISRMNILPKKRYFPPSFKRSYHKLTSKVIHL